MTDPENDTPHTATFTRHCPLHLIQIFVRPFGLLLFFFLPVFFFFAMEAPCLCG